MKYERLTKKGKKWIESNHDEVEAYNRLAELEDKIENGELVSKEEFENQTKEKAQNLAVKSIMNLTKQHEKELKQARKESAKEILQAVKLKCKELENKYSHLCKSKKEAMQETCRYEGVLAVKRELYEIAKQFGVEVEE